MDEKNAFNTDLDPEVIKIRDTNFKMVLPGSVMFILVFRYDEIKLFLFWYLMLLV